MEDLDADFDLEGLSATEEGEKVLHEGSANLADDKVKLLADLGIQNELLDAQARVGRAESFGERLGAIKALLFLSFKQLYNEKIKPRLPAAAIAAYLGIIAGVLIAVLAAPVLAAIGIALGVADVVMGLAEAIEGMERAATAKKGNKSEIKEGARLIARGAAKAFAAVVFRSHLLLHSRYLWAAARDWRHP